MLHSVVLSIVIQNKYLAPRIWAHAGHNHAGSLFTATQMLARDVFGTLPHVPALFMTSLVQTAALTHTFRFETFKRQFLTDE